MTAIVLGIALASATLGLEQGNGCPEGRSDVADERPTVCASRLTEPLALDGQLDEDVYRRALPIKDFVQSVPDEGARATESTEVWVMFDEENIYVSARCWDSAPAAEWVVNEMRRDTVQIRQNDTFGVSFDTFYDRRNGFVLYVNPIGGRADYAVTDEVANFDWNPVWDVRTARFDGGWTVEMQVPFKSLRYRSGTEQVWGVQFRRVLRHKNEWAYFSLVPASAAGSYGLTRVSLGGTLVNLELPAASRNLELKPYGTSRVTTDRTKTPAVTNDVARDFGLDAKYGVTANLTADFTYNTDFAQVEVDEQQVNLTRFSLLFPEKREFFLEGRGLFDFGRGTGGGAVDGTVPILFFTRRIGLEDGAVVPIDFGARLTGKVGKFGVGALNIQAGGEANVAPTNFTVVRVKRDVLRRSAIGAIFTSRSESGTDDRGTSQAYGIDGTFSFYQNVNFNGYLARTRTPGLTGRDTSHLAKFTYTGDRYGLQVDRLAVGERFNPEIGYVQRRDFARTFALARFSPRPQSIAAVRRFSSEGSLEYIVNGRGAVESRRQLGRFITEFQNSDQITVEATRNYELLVAPFQLGRGLTISPGDYDFSDVTLSYFLGGQHRANGTLTVQRGSFYGGTITMLGFLRGQISVTPRLMIEPGVSTTRVDLPHGKLTTNLIRARSDYSFTNRMFVSAILQYNSADRTLGGNMRFRWEYRPGSEFFVVYTDERNAIGSRFLLRNRVFAVKINRLFRF